MTADPSHTAWRPADWLHALARTAHARWPVGRSIRAGLSVGGPLLVGALVGEAAIGMWIAMGALLLAAGERSGPYGGRFRQIAVTAPIAAAAYLLGALSAAPWPVTVVVMGMLALASGVLSGVSNALSIGTMQALLIAAVAIGVPAAAPYWPAALLFVAGAVLYAGMLAIEMLLVRAGPWRTALSEVLTSLAGLARARAAEGADLMVPRRRFTTALDAFDTAAIALRARSMGPSDDTRRAAAISRAADHLFARLLAHDADPALCAQTADRLDAVADAVSHGRTRPAATTPPGRLLRLDLLESAIWSTAADDPAPAVRRQTRFTAGRDLWVTSARLAVTTALAYLAYFTLPIPHGYWIPLTVALVMKPDLGSVFGRAVLRSVGTIGGAVVAVGVGFVAPGAVGESIAIILLAAALPWAVARSYAYQALFLTPLIMLLIAAVAPDDSVGVLTLARIETTLAGGLIAIVAGYLVWPSARHPAVAPAFERALRALAGYAADVAAGRDGLADTRRAVYRTLSDVRVRLQRTLAEPPPAGTEAWSWIPAVTAAERIADRLTDISASRTHTDPHPDAESLAAIADRLVMLEREGPRAAPSEGRAPAASSADGGEGSALVRELSDDVDSLAPMIRRRG